MTWLYHDFQPGEQIRCMQLDVPQDARQLVQAAFPDLPPDQGDIELTIAMLMRAYTLLVDPRPPGNIHAEQNMRIFRTLRAGETVPATASCLEKERKSGRNWVVFEIRIGTVSDPVARVNMRMVWAQ
ncbi:hypothetical protein LA6_005447 (plasmid) [Paracoccaceae bacterium]|nr:hypothetical protein LA6_005447 [Paracoccaceae bacterium]